MASRRSRLRLSTRIASSQELLTPEEIAWLNAYHAQVRRTLSPLVDAKTRKWLREATKAL